MTQYRSIIDTHNEMIKVIPENKNQLIDNLNGFIDSLKNQKENKLKTKEFNIIFNIILYSKNV